MMKEEVNDGGRTRKKLAPDPKTSPHVRRLFDLGLENKTESQIAKTLNEEGIPGPGGKNGQPKGSTTPCITDTTKAQSSGDRAQTRNRRLSPRTLTKA